jgi:ATP-dependent DNA ligase
MLTRKGNELIGHFPEIAVDLAKLPDIAIDGELVMLNAQGKPEFHQLRGRCAIRDPGKRAMAAFTKPAAVFAFDVLQLKGKDLRTLPLMKRKETLHKELNERSRSALSIRSTLERTARNYSWLPTNWDWKA